MASLLSTRQALLVNALTGAVYPLAHGENIVGRSSSRQQADDEKKLPLEISSLDGNISRHQATVAVANHSDGIHVTLQTHRTAKVGRINKSLWSAIVHTNHNISYIVHTEPYQTLSWRALWVWKEFTRDIETRRDHEALPGTTCILCL